jgi:hypothetical protein
VPRLLRSPPWLPENRLTLMSWQLGREEVIRLQRQLRGGYTFCRDLDESAFGERCVKICVRRLNHVLSIFEEHYWNILATCDGLGFGGELCALLDILHFKLNTECV